MSTAKTTENKEPAKARVRCPEGCAKIAALELERREVILWRKAAKDALFDLTSGAADTATDDPTVIAKGLREATRLATETSAQVDLLCRLLSISPDPTADWVDTAVGAAKELETRAAEAVRGPLEQERSKALLQAEEAQNSTWLMSGALVTCTALITAIVTLAIVRWL